MTQRASPNRLIHEKNPYLLQHAFNPVDWHPWGKEAHDKARAENKPILLSIGYSTCHWCHVMEHESFSDPEIAAILNNNFIPIKLDREERPDIDKIYMTAVQALSGRGGWPLNVFLTPDLKPFYGGTYFPPAPKWGMQGFPQVLARIAELWAAERQGIESDAERISDSLKEMLQGPSIGPEPEAALLDRAFKAYESSFDPEHAGFGGAPKFPVAGNQTFLLRYFKRTQNEKALELVSKTLSNIASGGIYDHIGGGFHRYSTDAAWRLPHFEKMLYDNAQLAVNYLEAYQITKNPLFLKTAKETLDYVLTDLTSQQGGFYCAEDADSIATGNSDQPGEKSEGNFYLWHETEIRTILGSDANLFCRHYGITPEGNLSGDPHGEFNGKNILYLAEPITATATHFGYAVPEAEQKIETAKNKLIAVRNKRARPMRDEKVLSSWNGLMISAFTKGYELSEDPRYLNAAKKAAAFIRDHLYDTSSKTLWHCFSAGKRSIEGFSDDYAFLARGLLDLYEASAEETWLSFALELSEKLLSEFFDPYGGFYLARKNGNEGALHLILDDADSTEPCASSIATIVFLRLAEILDRKDLRGFAQKTLRRFSSLMNERPTSLAQMLSALDFSLSSSCQIALSGNLNSQEAHALLTEIRSHFLPNRALVYIPQNSASDLLPAVFKGMKPLNEKPAAYVCRDFSCRNPATSPEELSKILTEDWSLKIRS